MCPSRQNLESYLLGRLPEEDSSEFGSHLEACPDCLEAVQTFRCEDTLVAAIRTPPETLINPEIDLDELIRRLRILGSNGQSSETTAEVEKDAKPRDPGTGGVAEGILELLSPAETEGELGRIGSYRILQMLGCGGMGVVFEAEDSRLKRRVAIKMIRPALANSPTAVQRFLREAQATAAIRHDHIVTLHQVGEQGGIPYLAMELLPGESLDARMKREGMFSLPDVLRIGREIAEGLAAAHERGLIHRDIKPANVWLESPRDRVKVLDFGLASASQDDGHLTQEGALLGTPAYMAPEQAQGVKIDSRVDLYSLGCILYRMATGKAPFIGTDSISLLLAAISTEAAPPKSLRPDLPADISDFILRLLSKNPDHRPSTANEVVATIRTFESGHSTRPPSNVENMHRPTGPKSGRRWLTGLVSAALLFSILGYFAGSTVLRFATNKGVLIVETNDPTLAIEVRQNSLIVRDKTTEREFTLDAGEGEIKVFEKDGIALATKKFVLQRGGKTRLSVLVEELRKVPNAEKAKDNIPALPNAQSKPQIPGSLPEDAKAMWQVSGWNPPPELLAVLGETRQRVNHPVRSITFSPDGKWIATTSNFKHLHVWEAATMKLAAQFNVGMRVNAAFIQGGKTLAVAGEQMIFIDVATWQEKQNMPTIEARRIASSNDGQRLAVLHSNNFEVTLWDLSEVKPRRTHLLSLEKHGTPNGLVSISGDGKIVAIALEDSVLLWEPDRKEPTRILAVPKDLIPHGALAFSRNRQELIYGSFRWKIADQENALEKNAYNGFAISPSGDLIIGARGAYSDAIVFASKEKQAAPFFLSKANPRLTCADFSADGNLLATGGDAGDVRLWERKGREWVERNPIWGHRGFISTAQFSPDGKWLVSASHWDQLNHVWRFENGKTTFVAPIRLPHRVFGLSFAFDSKSLLMCSFPSFWLVPFAAEETQKFGPLRSFSAEPGDAVLLPGGKQYVAIDKEGLRYWQLSDSAEPLALKVMPGTQGFQHLALSADGSTLVLSKRKQKGELAIAVYRAERPGDEYTKALAQDIQTETLPRLVVSSNGRYIAFQQQGEIWDIGGPTAKFVGLNAPPSLAKHGLGFSPKANLVAFSDREVLKIYNLDKGLKLPLKTWKLPCDCSANPIFSPDGNYLVAPLANGTMFVFRVLDL